MGTIGRHAHSHPRLRLKEAQVVDLTKLPEGIERTNEVRTTELHFQCCVCYKVLPPQMVVVIFERKIGTPDWIVVGKKCLKH